MSKKAEETLILRDIFSHKHIKDNGDIVDINIQEVKKTQEYPELIETQGTQWEFARKLFDQNEGEKYSFFPLKPCS